MSAVKQELRKKLISQRRQLDISYANSVSGQITEHLISSSVYEQSSVVHCYASMKANNEISTWSILKKVISDGKSLVMSKMSSEFSLKHYFVEDLGNLKINKFGIAEPRGGEEANPRELELIIIPMLACDKKGNRLGYGAGYYDRFLKKSNGFRLGLCDQQFVLDEIQSEVHDQKLHGYITQNGLIIC